MPGSLGWVLPHLIEEPARDGGHADFLHEAIDGADGESQRRSGRAFEERRILASSQREVVDQLDGLLER